MKRCSNSSETLKALLFVYKHKMIFFFYRMYISSLYAFTRFLAPEDVPYVFTFDNTGKMPQFLTWRLFYVNYYSYVEYLDHERNMTKRASIPILCLGLETRYQQSIRVTLTTSNRVFCKINFRDCPVLTCFFIFLQNLQLNKTL